jgi:hypothetical protein
MSAIRRRLRTDAGVAFAQLAVIRESGEWVSVKIIGQVKTLEDWWV